MTNLQFYTTPEAVEECSVYRLQPEEKHLFAKYYRSGDRILDLACGLGRTTLILYEMGLSVRGIDASETLINVAKRRFPYLDLGVGSFARIEEPDSAYSHVLISSNALDLAYPESQRDIALRECLRVLKAGGTFIYSSHNLKALQLWSPRYWRSAPLWKLRNTLKAFRAKAYVFEGSLCGIFSSPEFVVQQTESIGFKFLEMIGPRMSSDRRLNKYFSINIHYAFMKPASEFPGSSKPPKP
jgi:ubiquinone/menaquinone biosynthesis C-methylase UbiE